MSQPLWKIVLKNSAKQYRESPGLWRKGVFGSLHNPVALKDRDRIIDAFRSGDLTCCPKIMILAQSLLLVGDDSFESLAGQAFTELCRHHGLPEHEDSIIEFNDGPACNSADDVAAFIEAALHPAREANKVPELV